MRQPTRASRGIGAGKTPPTDEDGLPTAEGDDGVDRTLILEFLRMSPAERLDVADGYAQEIEELRERLRRAPAGP